ncbi:hypothetical protein J2X45_003399 [Caulobacter sp. BE264]|uniref:hypothetical protein n=1 Tax=Caulobacter sp. BE264 TaxID=2817724 RepID=UPI002859092B|nr:hypothetical protein [Caulobacter sp. BE264]MDR7232293.1 hypothetical protein [Caulobacter sp. BE264]
MGTKREAILAAVETLLQSAVPLSSVSRDEVKADEIDPAGTFVVFDGDPGEPEIDLSPLRYTWTHRIPVSVGARGGDPRGLLDTVLKSVGVAISANRTLGGLCEWLDAEAPSPDPLEAPGTEVHRWTDLIIIATYATTSPLG